MNQREKNIANAVICMTYRELTDFAHAIGGDADKIIDWAELTVAPPADEVAK